MRSRRNSLVMVPSSWSGGSGPRGAALTLLRPIGLHAGRQAYWRVVCPAAARPCRSACVAMELVDQGVLWTRHAELAPSGSANRVSRVFRSRRDHGRPGTRRGPRGGHRLVRSDPADFPSELPPYIMALIAGPSGCTERGHTHLPPCGWDGTMFPSVRCDAGVRPCRGVPLALRRHGASRRSIRSKNGSGLGNGAV